MRAIFIFLIFTCIETVAHAETLKYKWTVQYAKTNPDGFFRTVIGINNGTIWQFPGPTIRAKYGDTITVLLQNGLASEATSIHWHGIDQRGTPWMDGVQQVTQYPILPGTSFNYTFRADPIGTHIYHSHTGGQYTDGLFGAVIIEDPNDPYKDIPDKVILINEWYHKTVIDTFDIFTQHIPTGPHYHPLVNFVSGLFNGKGRYNCSLLQPVDNNTCTPNMPYERILVNRSQIYRFRLISIGSQFTYILSIDQHNFTIIAVDGIYVNPYTIQRLTIGVGQRYDVLVSMNNTESNYWIRAVTQRTSQEFKAILQYSNSPNSSEPNSTYDTVNSSILTNLNNIIPTNRSNIPLTPPIFNITFTLNITCNEPVIDKCFMNGKQLGVPSTPTLLGLFWNDTSPYNETNIIDINYGDTVRIIINNFINGSHPLHLHGHDFYVIGEGSPNVGQISNLSSLENLSLNYVNPPIRDTTIIQNNSWLVLGFIANNPGSWLFHCHIPFDAQAGMGVVFNIKNSKILPPPNDYPLLVDFGSLPTSSAANLFAAFIKHFKLLYLILLFYPI